MPMWLVRAGKYGQQEDYALSNSRVVIGWVEIPSIENVSSRGEMKRLYAQYHPEATAMQVANNAGQLWAFKNGIKIGDLVILPLKTRSAIAVGKVKGDYGYDASLPEGASHYRDVEWLRDDIPRTDIGQDLLYSLGAFTTVCTISRNKAEIRFKEIIKGNADPYLKGKPDPPETEADNDSEESDESNVDFAQASIDKIVKLITAKYQGHELTRLVDEILKAQGYKTFRSPEGPDGGVDVLAGKGTMGFDKPRLCVQVKSVANPVDVTAVRELEGVMSRVNAEQGLFVSWSGFKNSVHRDMRHLFFKVRLWDSGELVANLLDSYERLNDTIQAEIPLKRIWTLVEEQ
jgi:restriction system protein